MPRIIGIDKTGRLVGEIFSVGSSGVPAGALLCDGSSYLASAYPFLSTALFDTNTLNYAFGSADNNFANLTVQDITYTAIAAGPTSIAITIGYTDGALAGFEVVTVVGNAIQVQIQSGVSTSDDITAAVIASVPASGLVTPVNNNPGAFETAPYGPTALLLHFNVPPPGVFFRSIDINSINDPDATSRTAYSTGGNSGVAVGSFQPHAFYVHDHGGSTGSNSNGANFIVHGSIGAQNNGQNALQGSYGGNHTHGIGAEGGDETRPTNVYLTYAIAYI